MERGRLGPNPAFGGPPPPPGAVESSAARSASSRSNGGAAAASTPRPVSRLENVPVEECAEYLSRPHTSWESATKEMARIEAKRQQQDDDTRSNASTVSAYSIKSASSVASSTSSVRRGHMSQLPSQMARSRTASEPPAPPMDFCVGGSSIGGFSFVAPRSATGAASCAAVGVVQQATKAAAGMPAGRSGAVRVAVPVVHPQSAPVGQQAPALGRVPVKLQGAGPVPPPDSYSMNGFVPRMAPKKR